MGENYSSIVIKIDATICRNENSKEEQLHLVAKTKQTVEAPILDWILTLKKEIFVYRELMPLYKDIAREVGIPENELIDLLPKYIGHWYSQRINTGKPDEYSMLVMENLQEHGFYYCNKRIGKFVDRS